MGIKLIVENKKARFDFHINETFEAGLVLLGSEVKSLRQGNAQIKDAYIAFVGSEIFLQKSNIAPYAASSYNNHHPERLRKLLLNRNEINKIYSATEERGFS